MKTRLVALAAMFITASLARAGEPAGIDGTVKSINPETREITILRANGKETTVKIGKATAIVVDRALDQTFDKIKEKQEVRCYFDLDSHACIHLRIFIELDRPAGNPPRYRW